MSQEQKLTIELYKSLRRSGMRGKRSVGWYELLPITADFILANHNGGNRNRSKTLEEKHAAFNLDGEWSATGDTIKLGKDGVVHDGYPAPETF